MKNRRKIIEMSRWKVEAAEGFQAMDPAETGEEPETAEYYTIEEAHDGTQHRRKTGKEKAAAKSKSALR